LLKEKNLVRILLHRCYILALAAGFIAIAHLANERPHTPDALTKLT